MDYEKFKGGMLADPRDARLLGGDARAESVLRCYFAVIEGSNLPDEYIPTLRKAFWFAHQEGVTLGSAKAAEIFVR
jgi:hypothetical protein